MISLGGAGTVSSYPDLATVAASALRSASTNSRRAATGPSPGTTPPPNSTNSGKSPWDWASGTSRQGRSCAAPTMPASFPLTVESFGYIHQSSFPGRSCLIWPPDLPCHGIGAGPFFTRRRGCAGGTSPGGVAGSWGGVDGTQQGRRARLDQGGGSWTALLNMVPPRRGPRRAWPKPPQPVPSDGNGLRCGSRSRHDERSAWPTPHRRADALPTCSHRRSLLGHLLSDSGEQHRRPARSTGRSSLPLPKTWTGVLQDAEGHHERAPSVLTSPVGPDRSIRSGWFARRQARLLKATTRIHHLSLPFEQTAGDARRLKAGAGKVQAVNHYNLWVRISRPFIFSLK